MPSYECCFFDRERKIVRSEVLRASGDLEAHREIMARMMRVGRFSGYELRCEGRKVEAYGSLNQTKAPSLNLAS
jgi:hypothetical protein